MNENLCIVSVVTAFASMRCGLSQHTEIDFDGFKVKDRTWGHNEIGVMRCARLYSAMNEESAVTAYRNFAPV
jgi:hypothetical protein